MKNENLSLTGNKLFDLRKRAVRMKQRGQTNQAVAEAFGVAESTVRRWWSLFNKGGVRALLPCKRGRKTGSHRSLTPEQEQEIRQLIVEKTPDQLKLPFALWTRRAVCNSSANILVLQLLSARQVVRCFTD